MQTAGTKAGPMLIAAVVMVNALIVGGGVALAHRAIGLAVAIGITAFAMLTLAITPTKPVGQRRTTND